MAAPPLQAAQLVPSPAPEAAAEADPEAPQAPTKVDVEPTAQDGDIAERLKGILDATTWFDEPTVHVEEGVVFLDGRTRDEGYKEWASNLARNTEGVVAVVNRLEVFTPTDWGFTTARDEFVLWGQYFAASLPTLVLASMILALALLSAKLAAYVIRRVMNARVPSHLLQEVTARAGGTLVFLLGLYFILRISGLTRLAVTVVGGTGLVGLILGIAFRDITENFLASLFLSLQHPFREGDLVQIGESLGYVQRLTSRTTVLMTLDGNQVQIPNSTVYKTSICNYTSNPNRRVDFLIGIGYDDAIPHAQEVALGVLAKHPAVLNDPEPWVLVDSLGAATVNLKVYFWLDGSKHSWLKVRSSVIRLIKRAFQDADISLPDEAREVVFPQGIPVRMLRDGEEDGKPVAATPPVAPRKPPSIPDEEVATVAEGGLRSQASEIQAQARQSWSPDRGENLLDVAAPPPQQSP